MEIIQTSIDDNNTFYRIIQPLFEKKKKAGAAMPMEQEEPLEKENSAAKEPAPELLPTKQRQRRAMFDGAAHLKLSARVSVCRRRLCRWQRCV